MRRAREERSFQSRLPARLRRQMTKLFLLLRHRAGAAPPEANRPFLTWPPVSGACDCRDLMTRLQWFLPREPASVFVSVTPGFRITPELHSEGTEVLDLPAREKAQIRFLASWREQHELLAAEPYILVWKLLDVRNIGLRRHLPRWYVIDPDWFSLVEELEWTLLYEAAKNPCDASELTGISRRNLDKLQAAARICTHVNVCGNGPSLNALVESGSGGFNLICNTAVQSDRIVERLRPAVVAFANSVFFGPSAFARKIIEGAARCVKDYGAVIVTPGGYAQHLIASNYPHLKQHTLGLSFGKDLAIPSPERLAVKQSSNVATALMLPLAAGLGVRLIEIWGCDGGAPEQRSRWSPWQYFSGGDPARDSATLAHPAFFRDRVITESYFNRYYQDHCEYFEKLLQFIEANGVEVRNRTPSRIPALARRLQDMSAALS